MKPLRFIITPLLTILWLMAALPGNFSDLVDAALKLPAATAASPADDADTGAPVEQIAGTFRTPPAAVRAEVTVRQSAAAAPAGRLIRPSIPATVFASVWQFLQRTAQTPRAPAFLA